MKKIITLVLAAMMLTLALTGCGAKKVKLTILDTEYAVEDYAICVAKENTELLDKINASIQKLKDSGKLQEIIDKYITAE